MRCLRPNQLTKNLFPIDYHFKGSKVYISNPSTLLYHMYKWGLQIILIRTTCSVIGDHFSPHLSPSQMKEQTRSPEQLVGGVHIGVQCVLGFENAHRAYFHCVHYALKTIHHAKLKHPTVSIYGDHSTIVPNQTIQQYSCGVT